MIDREDSLDRLLRRDATLALPDDGFSARVMTALAREVPPPWFKPMLIIGATALGSLLATTLSPLGETILQGFVEIGRLQLSSPSVLAAIAMAVTLIVSSFVLIADSE